MVFRVHADPGSPLGPVLQASRWGPASGGRVESSPWLIQAWAWLHHTFQAYLALKEVSLCRMCLIQ